MKGMTQAPLTVLTSHAVSPEVGLTGLVTSAVALFLTLFLYAYLVVDLVLFRRRMAKQVQWKPAAKAEDPTKVGDPLFRLRATTRVAVMGSAVLV